MPDFEKEAFWFVNRLVFLFLFIFKKRTRNLIISNIKVHEEEDEAKPIPSSNIGDQPGTDSPSLPITDELIHKDDNTPSQTVEKAQSNNSTKSKEKKNKNKSKSVRSRIELMHCDIIKDEFWDARPGLLYM
jgi:hypothetical protein